MIWSCFRHDLGIIQACFGHHSDMFWASFGHVLGIIQTCFGDHPDMFWASSRHVWPRLNPEPLGTGIRRNKIALGSAKRIFARMTRQRCKHSACNGRHELPKHKLSELYRTDFFRRDNDQSKELFPHSSSDQIECGFDRRSYFAEAEREARVPH